MGAADAVACFHQVRQVVVGDGFRAHTRTLSELLADARIVELQLSDWQQIEADAETYVRALPRGAELQRYHWPPFPLPFPTIWLGSTSPIPADGDDGTPMHLLGFLLSEGDVFGFAMKPDGTISLMQMLDSPGQWHAFMPGMAFAIGAVLGIIDHQAQALVVRGISPARRRKLRRLTDKTAPAAPVPRAYHRICVREKITWISEARRAMASCGPTWRTAHRHDVRGHWRLRIYRGPLPLPQEQRERLLARDYVICDEDGPELPDDLADKLRTRGLSGRRQGEWLAVLSIWVHAHQRGPADAPYVPAVWRVRPPPDPSV